MSDNVEELQINPELYDMVDGWVGPVLWRAVNLLFHYYESARRKTDSGDFNGAVSDEVGAAYMREVCARLAGASGKPSKEILAALEGFQEVRQ